MNLRVLPYYTVDHPLVENKKIIISDRNGINKTVNRVFEISGNKQTDRPRFIRVHISGEKCRPEKDSERIRLYEKDFREKEKLDFRKAKSTEIMRFTRSLIIAYLLFIAPEAFWTPIVSLFNLIAHGLSDYARWCIIAFFPLKAFIRTFGTLFYIRGTLNIGIPGRWHQIHESAKALDMFDDMDSSIEEKLNREIETVIKNIRRKATSQKHLADSTEEVLAGYSEKNPEILNEQLLALIREGETGELWGEMVKLNMLRKEILYFLSSGALNTSTIHHFSPGEKSPAVLKIPMAEIKFSSFSGQSGNLKSFNSSPKIISLKKSVLTAVEKLRKTESQKDRITLLEEITGAFETIRDEALRYHMGQNRFIPNEKGNDIALFYHNLFLIFGRTLCDIENGYRRSSMGITPLITEGARKRRVKRLFSDLDVFLTGKSPVKRKNLWRQIKTCGGINLPWGLTASFVILFITGSLLSLYIVSPGDRIIRSNIKIGYLDQFINREIKIIEPGSFIPIPFTGKELAWHLPRPLADHSIISSDLKEISLYMIMGEHYTDSPVQNLLSGLSGQLGTKFDVIEMTLKYTPLNAEKWSLYNSDGKGERRLIRDLSELSEEWREKRGVEFTSFTNREFEKFFRDLSDKGIIEEYLKRAFSQTTFSTNIYYGSLSERFESGINAVLGEFAKKREESASDPLVSAEEKESLEQNLSLATSIVVELQKTIEEQVKVEYSQLRSNPALLGRLVDNPYDNIQKLKDFESLWISISSYTRHLYQQKQIMDMLSGGFVDLTLKEEAGKLYPQHLDMAAYLQGNSLIEQLIEIRSVKFKKKTIGLTEFTQYQEKWKETI